MHLFKGSFLLPVVFVSPFQAKEIVCAGLLGTNRWTRDQCCHLKGQNLPKVTQDLIKSLNSPIIIKKT